MSNWILASYRDWLSPIVGLLKEKLLEQNYLHIDETPIQVLGELGRKNTTDSYMWVYCSIKAYKGYEKITRAPGASAGHIFADLL